MVRPEITGNQPIVEALSRVTEQDVVDFMRLLPQLSSKPLPESEIIQARLLTVVDPNNPDSQLFVIRDQGGHIQASATGNICRIPTGEKPWVDDVVTDSQHRGLGYGRALMDALHDWFEERGVNSVNLTSAPFRGAAGSLYESMGYKERDTRVYRKQLGDLAIISN